jgi:hypothetical protein
MYQNIKPKVGHLFQTKLPHLGADLSSRPAPQLLSREFPHLTADEAKTMNVIDTGEYLMRFQAIWARRRRFPSRFGSETDFGVPVTRIFAEPAINGKK